MTRNERFYSKIFTLKLLNSIILEKFNLIVEFIFIEEEL